MSSSLPVTHSSCPPVDTAPGQYPRAASLVRRIEHLLEVIRMERNRQDTANAKVADSISAVLATLEAELQVTRQAIHDHIDSHSDLKQRGDLLSTIPGIGDASIAHLLIVLSQHHTFINAKQVVAFAGRAPALRQSGQLSGNTHIAKNGDALLRKALYMPRHFARCVLIHQSVPSVSVLKRTAKTARPLPVPLCVS